MRGPSGRLQRYTDVLAFGLLTVPEVTSALLDVLAESDDRAALGVGAPASLRGPVQAYLAEIGR